mmetsp:Transcript_21221/g.48739  ORF Transcript_21221/g.48739 Transcript_21221/m.48739 type:complete len:1078 (+) Transcript_21221:67-3300(+)
MNRQPISSPQLAHRVSLLVSSPATSSTSGVLPSSSPRVTPVGSATVAAGCPRGSGSVTSSVGCRPSSASEACLHRPITRGGGSSRISLQSNGTSPAATPVTVIGGATRAAASPSVGQADGGVRQQQVAKLQSSSSSSSACLRGWTWPDQELVRSPATPSHARIPTPTGAFDADTEVTPGDLRAAAETLRELFSPEQVINIALTPPQQYAGVNESNDLDLAQTPHARLRMALRILGKTSTQGTVFRDMLLASAQQGSRASSKSSNAFTPQCTPTVCRPEDAGSGTQELRTPVSHSHTTAPSPSAVARDLNPRLLAAAGQPLRQGESIAAMALSAFRAPPGSPGPGASRCPRTPLARENADTVVVNVAGTSGSGEAPCEAGSDDELPPTKEPRQSTASTGRRSPKASQAPRQTPTSKRRNISPDSGSGCFPIGQVANPWAMSALSQRISVGEIPGRCISPVAGTRQVPPSSPAPKQRQVLHTCGPRRVGTSMPVPSAACAAVRENTTEKDSPASPRTPHVVSPPPRDSMIWKQVPGESPPASPRSGQRRMARSQSSRRLIAELDDKGQDMQLPIQHLTPSVQVRRIGKESPRPMLRRTGLSPVPGSLGVERGDQSPMGKVRSFSNSIRQASAVRISRDREGCQRAIAAQFASVHDDVAGEGPVRSFEPSRSRNASPTRGLNGNPLDFYAIGKLIGRGAFGKVNIGVHKLTEELTAMKLCERRRVAEAKKCLTQEVNILKRLNGHANLIQLFEVIETSTHIVLVMEYASGGDLLCHVRKRNSNRVDERAAQDFFKQLSDGLNYVHKCSVVHRDLKLENLLLDYAGCLKIADFGVAVIITPGKKLTDHCGTPSYMAPEILIEASAYDGPPVDVWSLGVVLYALLCGRVPFKGDSLADLKRSVLRGRLYMPAHLGVQATSLLEQMLVVDFRRRPTVQEVLNHQWLSGVLNRAEQIRALPDVRGSWSSLHVYPPPNGGHSGSAADGRAGSALSGALVAQVVAHSFPEDHVVQSLHKRDCNHATTTYYLLQQQSVRKKLNALTPSLSSSLTGGTGGLETEPLGLQDSDDEFTRSVSIAESMEAF